MTTGPSGSPTGSQSAQARVAPSIRDTIEAAHLRDGDVLSSTRELDSPRRPEVIYIGGYAGSGKSELGRILARQTGWAILDKDTLTRPVVEAALLLLGSSVDDRESETYVAQVRPREYEALAAAVRENVECGTSAIVTAPFLKEYADHAWLSRTRATLEDHGAHMTVVWVECDAETMHGYLRHRGAARDTHKLAHWPQYLASIDLDFRPPGEHRVINNSAGSPSLHQQARELLGSLTALT